MLRPLVDELGPLLIIFRRIGPTGEDFRIRVGRAPPVLIRIRSRRQVSRHETNLHVRPDTVGPVGIEHFIENCPIVDRIAALVLAIRIGGSPLQCGSTIAGSKQIMRAKVNGLGLQRAKFAQQLSAVRHRSVIRLVRAEESPDRTQPAP